MLINNEEAFQYKYNNNYYITKTGKIYSTYVIGGVLYMKEASLFFNKSKGSVSSAIKNNEYRSKINKYVITFPNVSTIENTSLL